MEKGVKVGFMCLKFSKTQVTKLRFNPYPGRFGICLRHTSYIFLFVLMQFTLTVNAQENNEIVQGEISYISGNSIYVKFASTEGIENGDTLYIKQNEKLIPGLVVLHHSSISCLCKKVTNNTINVGDKFIARKRKLVLDESEKITKEGSDVERDVNEIVLTSVSGRKERKSDFSGRLSVSTYSAFSESDNSDSHRFRYSLAMNADHIAKSKLSAETYVLFTHRTGEWDVVKNNLFDALKIYSLALKYEVTPTANIWVGRKINPRIANVGAVDGIQLEKQWNNIYTGVVAGTRPDYEDYGYNPDLFEYGAYVGHYSTKDNRFVQTSLAYFEQQNGGSTDRRFVYFQHSNSLLKNLLVFSSVEADLFKIQDGNPKNELSLTGLYLSLKYNFTKDLSLLASYDNRKNVIYYETFKNYSDEVLQQVNRQGYRLRLNYRPVKYLNVALNAGTRRADDDPKPNNTYGVNVSYAKIPVIDAMLGIYGNVMQTSYLDGKIYGGRLSKDLLKSKLYLVTGYRRVFFDYNNFGSTLKQHIADLDLSYYFNKKLYLSVNVETTIQHQNNYNRVYLNLRKKF